MNYYKQGDAVNADKIKAAFESKAIYSNLNFANENYLYYSCDGTVAFCFICGGLANIIKTHPDYKELELPVEPKFKVGDWLWHNTLGVHPILVKDYSEQKGYKVEGLGLTYYVQKGVIENEYRLWTIADAKDGDVLATDNGWTCIFQAFDGCGFSSYCFMDSKRWFCESGSEVHTPDSRINGKIHPATKEQRDLLFAKIREVGYQWDADKKELKKIKSHYNISNFYAGMPVLVRWYDTGKWRYSLYSFYEEDSISKFDTVKGSFTQCIPFNDDTKHLLGTTNPCDEQYINW